jgi:putative thioredoxin
MAHDVTDFQSEVLERSRTVPVLVDFWAEWCGPCRVLGPVLERLAARAGGRWELAKVDTEALPETAAAYGVQGIPAVKLFVNGEVVDEFVGARPEPQVQLWLEQALPPSISAELDAALALLESGEFAAAAAALDGIVTAEPGNGAARLGLARALLHVAPERVDAAVTALAEDDERADRAAAIQLLAEFARRAAGPKVDPRLAEAARAVRLADWPKALDAVLLLLRFRNDPGAARAREIGRAIFILLGSGHPVFERYHRAFSSAMHV